MNYVVVFELSPTSFRMIMENICSCNLLNITCQQQISIYSAHKPTTKCIMKKSTISGKQVVMYVEYHNIFIPINTGLSNLLMVWNSFAKGQRGTGFGFVSKLEFCDQPGKNLVF